MSHNTPSSFWHIVLLNTTGKLLEKVISNRLQFHMTANSFLDPNQLGGIKQRSTTDVGIYLTHLIHAGWLRQCHTSVIVFDIAKSFPSLNHKFLSQTSFGHISINSSSIQTVSMATESPWKDLSIDASHVSRQSIMAEILGRSTGNHHGTVY